MSRTDLTVVFSFPSAALHPKYLEEPSLLGIELVEALRNEWGRDGVDVRLLSGVDSVVIDGTAEELPDFVTESVWDDVDLEGVDEDDDASEADD